MKSAKNRVIDFIVNGELLALILRIGLKGGEYLRLLVTAEFLG